MVFRVLQLTVRHLGVVPWLPERVEDAEEHAGSDYPPQPSA